MSLFFFIIYLIYLICIFIVIYYMCRYFALILFYGVCCTAFVLITMAKRFGSVFDPIVSE